ncbi:MAG: ribulose phosphate epimerase, partial [Myxococcales bacterium]|nr:ribulose phosphate epimerase [Myxococcales bacterium]
CAAINTCDAGLWCAAAGAVPGCAGSDGCCTSFCDLDEGAACLGAGQECVAWFDVGEAPPGAETLGACVIPD